jgi:propionyl-CoA carboxylase alpha chain
MFTKILIANRGEIACRVIKTARKMGIATVAVYSEADKNARHVALADEAVCIGPAASRLSYLVQDNIIAACKQTGAQAVHPGYGFLSENAGFAKRLEEEGVVFIGPKHHSIAAMGDKIESKKLAGAAGVNCIPGYNEAIELPEQAVEIAKNIGYPVMIKASAGGGGKGLRVAHNDKEAFEGFTSCRNEARNSFGDDRVFIEKFVEEPRHIEIQVLGDSQGNVVYLHERECSIQRRHQKVIEEAPSPFINDATRKAMGEQAVQLAKAVQYQSAGTVEFVVGKDQSFYFLEMNTRLQVEHPVTELITGLDLVEQMIRVAAGEALAFKQADIQKNGWAMECRINAEDPLRNFLPSTGRLVKFAPPAQTLFAGEISHHSVRAEPVEAPVAMQTSPSTSSGRTVSNGFGGVRVDTGVQEGGEIPMHYDSMICKLIVHGVDRADAIAKMTAALNQFVIRGISSNIGFQSALMAHPDFQSGAFNTGFIAANYPKGFTRDSVLKTDSALMQAAAVIAHHVYQMQASLSTGQINAALGSGVTNREEWVAAIGGVQTAVSLKQNASYYEMALSGKTLTLQTDWRIGDALMSGTVDGAAFDVQIERAGLAYRVVHSGAADTIHVFSPHVAALAQLMPAKSAPDMSKFVLSPMPGLLVDIAVKVGQQVQAGERVAVIEAMKMENVLFAAADGVVVEIAPKQGDSLSVDQMIVRFA